MKLNINEVLENYSENTVRSSKSALKSLLGKYKNIDDLTLDDLINLNDQQVSEWIDELNCQGISQKTINTRLSLISNTIKNIERVYNVKLSINVDKYRKNTVETKDTRFTNATLLTDKEIQTLKECTNLLSNDLIELRDSIVIYLLIETGLKRSNLPKIMIYDINYDEKSLEVIINDEINIFPLSNELVNAIRLYIHKRGLNETVEKPLIISHSSNAVDKLIDGTTIYRIVKKYSLLSNLDSSRITIENIHKYHDYKKSIEPLINKSIINEINRCIYRESEKNEKSLYSIRNCFMIYLIVNYGVSNSELCLIRISDIFSDLNGVYLVNGRNKRIVNFDKEAKRLLKVYLCIREEYNVDNSYLLVSEQFHNKLNCGSVRRILLGFLEENNLPVITVRDFRLNYIRQFYSDSDKVRFAEELTGHKSDAFLLNNLRHSKK